MLYAACFVVISYLVGARVSEVLHLRAGCIQPRPTLGVSGATEIEVMTGTIFKHDRGYFGRPHEWVVPQVAIHAVSVLEALSAPNRERAGRSELWLRARTAARTMGATEWQREPVRSQCGPGHHAHHDDGVSAALCSLVKPAVF